MTDMLPLPDKTALRVIARHLGFTVVERNGMFSLYAPTTDHEGQCLGTMSAVTWLDHMRRMIEKGQRS